MMWILCTGIGFKGGLKVYPAESYKGIQYFLRIAFENRVSHQNNSLKKAMIDLKHASIESSHDRASILRSRKHERESQNGFY